MERIKLNAEIREETGKNKVKKMRKEKLVPACLYKAGEETKNLKVDKANLREALHTKAGENVLVDLIVGDKGKKPKPVMIKEVQYHPIRNEVLHVDFNEISLTKEIKVNIPVVTKGKADAVTREEGTVEHIMWEIEIECLPTEIPEKIEVDISELKIGDKIFVKDLAIPSEIKVLSDPELIVLSGEPPHKLEEVVEPTAEGEEATEPEVISKGKKEEEGEAAEEAAPPKEEKKEKKEEKKG